MSTNDFNGHTPGPWAVSMPGGQTAFNGRRVTVTHNGSMIADPDWNSPKANMANARLIAAAPDLLAALTDAIRQRDTAQTALQEYREDRRTLAGQVQRFETNLAALTAERDALRDVCNTALDLIEPNTHQHRLVLDRIRAALTPAATPESDGGK